MAGGLLSGCSSGSAAEKGGDTSGGESPTATNASGIGVVVDPAITEDADMDPKPYILTAISIGLEGAATGMALAGGHWPLSLLFLLLPVLFAINGWRAVGRARMRKTECREFVVDGCHNIIIAGDD